jgi:hypothetical protein
MEDTMTHKEPRRRSRTQKRSLSDAELDRLWEEVRAADEVDAGSEADLPEGVALPQEPGAVLAIFIQRKGSSR